jgi:mRNA-degrading endonuclease RelE of RelBE toxin-antitoxin system
MLRELRQWRSIFHVKFIETGVFTRRITDALSDDEYRLLQEALLRRPTQGDLIEGTGGVRKLRWKEQGRGKRGGLRVIYYWHVEREICLMLFLYRKSEQKDLTADQRRVLANVVVQEFK